MGTFSNCISQNMALYIHLHRKFQDCNNHFQLIHQTKPDLEVLELIVVVIRYYYQNE